MHLAPATISLLVGVAGVGALLLLILRARAQPFVALLLVSVGVGLAGGIAPAALPGVIEGGVGATLGHVALIVALGAMIGRLVDLSGGADRLAAALMRLFGPSRAAAGLATAGLLVGIPVFFEVGVVMLMPLAQGAARRSAKPLPGLALPLCIVLLVVHALLPPHPGAVAAASLLHVDLARLVLWSAPVVLVTAVFAAGLAMLLTRGMRPAQTPGQDPEAAAADEGAVEPPAALTVAALIVLPILLILAGSVASTALPPGAPLRAALSLLGSPFLALLIDVGLCAWVLGVRRGWSLQRVGDVLGSALPAVAIVILITGAGGGFARVLVASGVGAAVSSALGSTGLPLLALAYLLALLLRVAQGPTAVAIIAAAGIVAPPLAQAHLGADRTALVCAALGAGGMFGSHVNDAGFWIVTRLIGLDVAQGLRTWTVLSAASSVFAFATIALLWRLA